MKEKMSKLNFKMKKFIKNIFIIILALVFVPQVTFAKSTGYQAIYEPTKLEIEDLSFDSVKFTDNTKTTSQSFGLSGLVYNKNNSDISIKTTVDYYDSSYHLLASQTNEQTVKSKRYNTYYQMSNLDILENHELSEIKYYELKIDNYELKKTEDKLYSIPSESNLYRSYDYVIDKYNVNIVVNENNTFDITENIEAYFNIPKHGIFRTIPLKNELTRLDGTKSKNRVKITNVSVNTKYSTLKEAGNYKIKIGSADETFTGAQSYEIKYTYNLGKDPLKNIDELYYNIIGDEWDTVIGNITFTIKMPKSFDASKLGFSSGYEGETFNDKIKFNVSDNVITGSYDNILLENNAITVRCELPEGYFVNASLQNKSLIFLMFLIPIVSLIVAFILWFKYGKDEPVIETVEFYPPEGFNSLDVGFLYNGKSSEKDVVSLLVYLANKGYIKISEIERTSLFSKEKDFRLTKLKDYDGNNIHEQLFLKGLFKDKNEVTSSDLENEFYLTVRKILNDVNTKENKQKIFMKETKTKSLVVLILIIASILVIVGIPTLDYGGVEELTITLFLTLFYVPFYAVLFIKNIQLVFKLLWGGFTLFHSFMFFLTMPIKDAILENNTYLFGMIVGVLSIIGMAFILSKMPKRTKYGNEILGKLKGFKNFLETAEKDKLEALVLENPSYFYDILPFTYVLGVSDKWIEKFETILIESPFWYDSPNTFNTRSFGRFMDSTMTSAQVSMTSVPSSSSGSGSYSSGGGSAGGGSGGGGGGSW